MAEKKPARPHSGARIALITLVTFGLAIVILATVRRSKEAEATDTALQLAPTSPVAEAALAAPLPATPPDKATTPAATATTTTRAGAKTAPVTRSTKTEESRSAPTKVDDQPATSSKAEVFTPTPEPAAAAHMESARAAALVTIEGCLERKSDRFRLTDTDGANAPKSRSWKSGFLKKRSRALDVTDAPNGLLLRGYTGRRVSVTGTFVDGELHARSVERANGSCN
jgi:hypothetical protein